MTKYVIQPLTNVSKAFEPSLSKDAKFKYEQTFKVTSTCSRNCKEVKNVISVRKEKPFCHFARKKNLRKTAINQRKRKSEKPRWLFILIEMKFPKF